MKQHHKVLLCISLLCVSTVSGAATEPVAAPVPRLMPQPPLPPGWQPAPSSTSEWADRCTDARVNSWGFKDPKNFVRLLEAFSDPALFLEFARRMEDPESYARMLSLMLEPETAKNYLEWSDPVIYAKWSQALLDPNFATAAVRPLLDPNTSLRWLSLPVDQRTWSVGLNMFNPGTWLKWATAPLNPKVMAPLFKVMDPTTTVRWFQVASDPSNLRSLSSLSPVSLNGTLLTQSRP